MAETFDNASSTGVGTSQTTIYTSPSGTKTVVFSLSLANLKNNGISAVVEVTDTSAGTTVKVLNNAPIPSGSTIVPFGGDQKLVLNAGDILKVTASEASAIDVFASVLQIT